MGVDDAHFLPAVVDEPIPQDEELLVVVIHIAEVLDPQFLQLPLHLPHLILAIIVHILWGYSFEDVGRVEVHLLFFCHCSLDFGHYVGQNVFASEL